MALGFYITGTGFTQEWYDTTTAQLEEAGAGVPEGRISHVALETGGEIQVFDIGESQEAFEAFGATLIPIRNAAGIELNRADGGPGSQRDQRLTDHIDRAG
ncbi:MAG: hypothetical protein M3065_20725 [Actinomycetota bacterium]|nr:hypothetical protein [Actinomycetota bacterium]